MNIRIFLVRCPNFICCTSGFFFVESLYLDDPGCGALEIQAVIDRNSGQMTQAVDSRSFKLSLTGTVGSQPRMWNPGDVSCQWQVLWAADHGPKEDKVKL